MKGLTASHIQHQCDEICGSTSCSAYWRMLRDALCHGQGLPTFASEPPSFQEEAEEEEEEEGVAVAKELPENLNMIKEKEETIRKSSKNHKK